MKIAMPLVNDFELDEMSATLDILRRANIKVDTISLSNEDIVTSSNKVKILADKKLNQINFDDYSMIILTGGKGTNSYMNYDFLISNLKKFNKENKKIAAICAAPSILARIGILENKMATVFPGYENILEENKALLTFYGVVKSYNIITATSMNFSIDFGLEIVEDLLGIEARLKIEKEIVRL